MNVRMDWRHYLEWSFSFFPLLQGTAVLWAFAYLLRDLSCLSVALLLFSIYLLPLLTFRILQPLFPVRRGVYPIGQKGISGWVLLLKIQMFLTTFPVFERCLHLVPGLYSLWLRAWGSSIGKGVLWTPHVEVIDRPLVRIGDYATLGHRCLLSAHAISMVRGKHVVYCKEVTVGTAALIGGYSVLGPGSVAGNFSQLNAGSHLYPNQVVAEGKTHDPRK